MISMICHCIGNEMDNVKGRQMPVHYTYRDGRFISVSSPVGTQFSQAVGVALASDYRDLTKSRLHGLAMALVRRGTIITR